METESQQSREREDALSALNEFIKTFNLAEKISRNPPAKAVFGSVSALLATIRVSLLASRRSNTDSAQWTQDTTIDKEDYIELGLVCADVCATFKRRVGGKREDDLSRTVGEAIKLMIK